MSLSKTNSPQLIELGTKLTAEYFYAASGRLMQDSGNLPMNLLGNGDVARLADFNSSILDSGEASEIALNADPVWANVSPSREKGVGRWEMTAEIVEDGDVLDTTLNGIADALASWKDGKLSAVLDAGVTGSTIADNASLALSDVSALAGDLPNAAILPTVYGSTKVFNLLKSLEHTVGFDSGEGMVAGLPFAAIDLSYSDVSDDPVLFVGHLSKCLLACQSEDKVMMTDQALNSSNALNDMLTIVATSRIASVVVDPRWVKKLSIA